MKKTPTEIEEIAQRIFASAQTRKVECDNLLQQSKDCQDTNRSAWLHELAHLKAEINALQVSFDVMSEVDADQEYMVLLDDAVNMKMLEAAKAEGHDTSKFEKMMAIKAKAAELKEKLNDPNCDATEVLQGLTDLAKDAGDPQKALTGPPPAALTEMMQKLMGKGQQKQAPSGLQALFGNGPIYRAGGRKHVDEDETTSLN